MRVSSYSVTLYRIFPRSRSHILLRKEKSASVLRRLGMLAELLPKPKVPTACTINGILSKDPGLERKILTEMGWSGHNPNRFPEAGLLCACLVGGLVSLLLSPPPSDSSHKCLSTSRPRGNKEILEIPNGVSLSVCLWGAGSREAQSAAKGPRSV